MNTRCTRCDKEEFIIVKGKQQKIYKSKNGTERIRLVVECNNCQAQFIADTELKNIYK